MPEFYTESFTSYYNKIMSNPFTSAMDFTSDTYMYLADVPGMDRQFLGYFLLSSSYNALPAPCSTVYTCGYAECYDFSVHGDYWEDPYDTVYQGGAEVTL